MEKQHYILNLSLKELAVRKLAIVLWTRADVLALVKSFHCQSLTGKILEWQKTVEHVVKEKIPILMLPVPLKEELEQVIKPIGPEILKWKMHHKLLKSYKHFTLDQLSWTSVGKVDYRKTAEILIRQERINIISSYKLACLYCLDDYIPIIWRKLSEKSKKLFYDDENIFEIRKPELVIFWTYLIRGEVAKLDVLINRNNDGRIRTLYQYAFECAAQSGNKAATEYFFEKLTFEEREASLLETALRVANKQYFHRYGFLCDFPKENFCDVLFYLLPQMEQEEQMEVFKKHPYRALRCFMNWPWQDLFGKVVALMCSFLNDGEYESLMMVLATDSTMAGYKYPKLCGALFLNAPSHYQQLMISKQIEHGLWFRELLSGPYADTIKLILRNVDEEERLGLILCEFGLLICACLIREENWFALNLFVSECRLSSEAKTILKWSFMRYLPSFRTELSKSKCERFFQMIDNANVNNDNKRIIEESEKEEHSTNSKPKRKCRRKY